MNDWIEEHRLTAEVTATATVVGSVLTLAPGWSWALATGHPMAFALSAPRCPHSATPPARLASA